jgi:hypothetical protein
MNSKKIKIKWSVVRVGGEKGNYYGSFIRLFIFTDNELHLRFL